jgi:hypothetical protein
MAAFDGLVGGLRRAEKELAAQLAGIRVAISSLAGTAMRRGRGLGRRARKGQEGGIIIVGGKRKRRRRGWSAAQKKAAANRMKKYWKARKARERKSK